MEAHQVLENSLREGKEGVVFKGPFVVEETRRQCNRKQGSEGSDDIGHATELKWSHIVCLEAWKSLAPRYLQQCPCHSAKGAPF